MRLIRYSLVVVTTLMACSDPGASLEIVGTRASRTEDGRVVVDVDVLAQERLGGNIGTYCTRVTFDGQPNPAEVCRRDLEDGDTAVVRIASDLVLLEGAAIAVRVRLGATDAQRSLVAPPR